MFLTRKLTLTEWIFTLYHDINETKKTNILYVKSKCPSLIDMPKLLIMFWKTLSLKMFGNFRDEDSSMQYISISLKTKQNLTLWYAFK